MPATHSVVAVLPVPEAYWPPSASLHQDFAADGWYMPVGHGVHVEAPPDEGEYDPAAQALCAVFPVPVTYWPPSASVQYERPV